MIEQLGAVLKIVWGNGGGIGLMVGASHRIVTEKSKLAMPEITIGLYPDIGGTGFKQNAFCLWFVFRFNGARLDGADCRFLGLADYYIESDSKKIGKSSGAGRLEWRTL